MRSLAEPCGALRSLAAAAGTRGRVTFDRTQQFYFHGARINVIFTQAVFFFLIKCDWLSRLSMKRLPANSLTFIGCGYLSIKVRSPDWAKSSLKPSPSTEGSLRNLIGSPSGQSRHGLLPLAVFSQVGGNSGKKTFPCLSYAKQKETLINRLETRIEFRKYHFPEAGKSPWFEL